jgi:hypothetical protein
MKAALPSCIRVCQIISKLRLEVAGLGRCVGSRAGSSISEEPAASMFRVKESAGWS